MPFITAMGRDSMDTPTPIASAKLRHVIALTLAARILLLLLTLGITGASLSSYLEMHDGRDYIAFADALDSSSLRAARQWVVVRFPGFPVAVYLLGSVLGKSWGIAALLLNVGGALLAVYLFDRIFRDRLATLYFAVFPPSWLLFSSINSTEGFFLAINLLGLYLIWNRRQTTAGYLTLGLSALIRPFAVFVIAARAIYLFLYGKKFRAVQLALIAALPLAAWLVFCRIYYGAFSHNVREYASIWNQQTFDWPFKALIEHTISSGRPLKIALVWATVAFSTFAMLVAVWNWLRDRRSEKWFTLAFWQVFSVLFYFSLGSENPFLSLDRYILTALPAQMISVRAFLPRGRAVVFLTWLASAAVVLYWNFNHLARLAGGG